jgi:tyrosinase
MVDKVFYDWQHADPANAGIYFGGSTQMIDNYTIYQEYPNGGPPFFNVSAFIRVFVSFEK